MKKKKKLNKYNSMIVRLRKDSKMTQVELCKQAKISQGSLSKYESGRDLPVICFTKILKVFGVEIQFKESDV